MCVYVHIYICVWFVLVFLFFHNNLTSKISQKLVALRNNVVFFAAKSKEGLVKFNFQLIFHYLTAQPLRQFYIYDQIFQIMVT